jgi:hypothetical protein
MSKEELAEISASLNTVAKVLAGATATAAGLLTALGLSSDRAWLLLDQDPLSLWLIIACIGAVIAIGFSLWALLIRPQHHRKQAWVLGIGAFFYVASLSAVLLVAGKAGDRAGAPLIESATIQGSGAERVLEVRIVGQQLDANQTASVTVELGSDTLYASAIPPDFEGKIDQSVVIPLLPDTEGQTLKVTAWRPDRGQPDCDHIRRYGPSCVTIAVAS